MTYTPKFSTTYRKTVQTLDGVSTDIWAIPVPADKSIIFTFRGFAWDQTNDTGASAEGTGEADNDGGTTTLTNNTTQLNFARTTFGGGGAYINIQANDGDDTIEVQVNGGGAYTIDWEFYFEVKEIG